MRVILVLVLHFHTALHNIFRINENTQNWNIVILLKCTIFTWYVSSELCVSILAAFIRVKPSRQEGQQTNKDFFNWKLLTY
jgi:hypothetical protein